MFRPTVATTAALLAVLARPGLATAATPTVLDSQVGQLQITAVATGLEEPWGLAFLPDGGFLVTERDGRLRLFGPDGSGGAAVEGIPAVHAEGQGGLLDVTLPRDFATSREVWLTYASPQGSGAGTALLRGRLSDDGTRLEAVRLLFEAPKGGRGGRHFGSRVVEAADGTLYLTIGDRGTGPDGMQAQDPMRAEGKVIHLNRDGTPATRLAGHLPGVFSLGHRNPQGAALDARGTLWLVEHGARGGDEVNRVVRGGNYGWPVISYGVNYNGDSIGVGTAQGGMEQPLHFWDPSIAPSGLIVHSGTGTPDWAGDFFTGSLNSDYISRLDPEAGFAEERLGAPETARVRDLAEAPDGAIWFLSVIDGAVYRMAPPG